MTTAAPTDRTMLDTITEQQPYNAEFERFERSAPGEWLAPARREAFARFTELGFPTTRHEEWRFTNTAALARTPFGIPAAGAKVHVPSDLSAWSFGEEDANQLVFVNGRFHEELSTLKGMHRGVRVRSLRDAIESAPSEIEPYLGRIADIGSRAFPALNMAFLADGAYIRIPKGVVVPKVIHVLFLATGGAGPLMFHPRVLLVADEGSQVTLAESFAGVDGAVHFTNSVTEIAAGPDAVVEHYRLQRETEATFHVSSLDVRQERGSTFASHSISLGAGLARNEARVVLDGEGCDCTLNGLYVTHARQHADNYTTIDHAKPHCTSRELYKGILDEKSTGVFRGRIIVRADAQKTNSRQTNRNLLLSSDAVVNTVPQLEIFADDVKCSHGATIGQLEDEELFYLRSRGIGEAEARTILTHAFAGEILRAVRIAPVQCQLDLAVLNRLSRLQQTEVS